MAQSTTLEVLRNFDPVRIFESEVSEQFQISKNAIFIEFTQSEFINDIRKNTYKYSFKE